MNDFLISRSAFLDALVLDADNKTDLIQVHQALEKAVISTDEVRDVAFWVDTQPHLNDSSYKKDGMSYYCSNCHHRAGKYKHRTYRFCPWCGAKIVKKGENDDKQYQLHG